MIGVFLIVLICQPRAKPIRKRWEGVETRRSTRNVKSTEKRPRAPTTLT